jgi:hypothetical protein
MRSRARVIGFLMCITPVTAPASRVRPSMIEASSSLAASVVNTAPFPALNRGESSRKVTAASTASTLSPPPWSAW